MRSNSIRRSQSVSRRSMIAANCARANDPALSSTNGAPATNARSRATGPARFKSIRSIWDVPAKADTSSRKPRTSGESVSNRSARSRSCGTASGRIALPNTTSNVIPCRWQSAARSPLSAAWRSRSNACRGSVTSIPYLVQLGHGVTASEFYTCRSTNERCGCPSTDEAISPEGRPVLHQLGQHQA